MVKPRARDDGFTYVGLIVLVAIVGLVGAATLKVDTLLQRAAAEEELLEAGAAFSAALASYAEATPRGQPTQPPSLQELLKDPRFPGVRRHLRKIFVDPITGTTDWGIVYANKAGDGPGTGVLAVYSLSKTKPLKQANFDARFQNLEHREHISDWKFAATGQGVVQGQQGQPPVPNGLPGQMPEQPAQAVSPGQEGKPGEPPSLFAGRGNPGTVQAGKPAEAPPPPEPAPAPASEPPQSEPVPPPDSTDRDKDRDRDKDEKEENRAGQDTQSDDSRRQAGR